MDLIPGTRLIPASVLLKDHRVCIKPTINVVSFDLVDTAEKFSSIGGCRRDNGRPSKDGTPEKVGLRKALAENWRNGKGLDIK
jgi:hypothetical protein